jgi:UDP-N-acetyl-D-glucosamine dehydrogenase
MSATVRQLRDRLAGAPTIGVIGLGYVGLPLAVAFAESGATVIGVDLDARRVAGVSGGESFIEDVPTATLGPLVRSGRLGATSDVTALKEADAIVICVPTPLGKSKEPDISFIVSAADAVASIIHTGQLVVLESTTYPGTTQEILLPRFAARGLGVGEDFFLAFSPERIDPGNKKWTLREIPKVVGGVTPACRELVAALYGRITPRVVPVSGPETAEMVKLFENTFRSVNIALANELALMCDRLGISVWEVIDAASTKPFGFLPHYPGPGLGGDCIPVVPHFLAWRLREYGYSAQLIDAAHEVNAHMPIYVVQKIADALNQEGLPIKDSRLLLLGMAYKPNVHDMRESPSLEVMRQLLAREGDVRYCDPWVPEIELDGVRHRGVEWSAESVAQADCVVVLTAHRQFLDEPHWPDARLIVDTRNVVRPAANVRSI